jgi:murein DD-endopeptidase MepM/ murein hydrolase activator NlpD
VRSAGERHIRGTIDPSPQPRRSRKLLRARRYPEPQRLRFRPVTQFSAIVGLLAVVVGFGFFPVQVAGQHTTPTLQASRVSLPGLAVAAPQSMAAELSAEPALLTVVVPRTNQDALLSAEDLTAGARASIEEQQQASSTSADDGAIESARAQDRIPIFFEHRVQEGETVTSIAARYGIGTQYIGWNNVDVLQNVNVLPVGTMLQIPSVEGIVHSVRFGETVSQIAVKYDAEIREIVDFRANGLLGDPNNLREDTLILVPGGRIVPPVQQATRPPAAPSGGSPDVGAGGWIWPATGMLTNSFGPIHPLGIDLAMASGTPLRAANSGTVVFVGGNACCNYGYHVIIDHGNGYDSLYAHMSDFNVSSGQRVDAGDVIGWSGNTGRSTGPHLHFEIRRNGVHQDPMSFLP